MPKYIEKYDKIIYNYISDLSQSVIIVYYKVETSL